MKVGVRREMNGERKGRKNIGLKIRYAAGDTWMRGGDDNAERGMSDRGTRPGGKTNGGIVTGRKKGPR